MDFRHPSYTRVSASSYSARISYRGLTPLPQTRLLRKSLIFLGRCDRRAHGSPAGISSEPRWRRRLRKARSSHATSTQCLSVHLSITHPAGELTWPALTKSRAGKVPGLGRDWPRGEGGLGDVDATITSIQNTFFRCPYFCWLHTGGQFSPGSKESRRRSRRR